MSEWKCEDKKTLINQWETLKYCSFESYICIEIDRHWEKLFLSQESFTDNTQWREDKHYKIEKSVQQLSISWLGHNRNANIWEVFMRVKAALLPIRTNLLEARNKYFMISLKEKWDVEKLHSL